MVTIGLFTSRLGWLPLRTVYLTSWLTATLHSLPHVLVDCHFAQFTSRLGWLPLCTVYLTSWLTATLHSLPHVLVDCHFAPFTSRLGWLPLCTVYLTSWLTATLHRLPHILVDCHFAPFQPDPQSRLTKWYHPCICLLAMHKLICVTFSLPPGVRGWLHLLLVALPALFYLPFCMVS